MKYSRSLSPALLAGLFMLPAVSMAGGSLATVSDLSGVVLVGGGERFSTAAVGSNLTAGSRVLTMEGAKATLVYGDGCKLQLGANTMVSLKSADECTRNTVESEAVDRQYASLGEVEDQAPGPDDAAYLLEGGEGGSGAATAPYEATHASTATAGSAAAIPVAAGVVGVAAVGTGIYFISKSGDNNNDFDVSGANF